MRIQRKLVSYAAGVVGAAALALLSPAALANTVTGDVWFVSNPIASAATPGNVPVTAPNVIFTAPSPLNFTTGDYTVGGFLGTGGATIVSSTPGALTTTINSGGGGILIDFTGTVTVTTGETFTVQHDDGLTLVIGGVTVISEPGPTAAVTTTATYTGGPGNLAFNLVYGECCGAPAVLNISLPLVTVTGVPEPDSVVLSAAGLLGLGAFAVRRRRNS